MGSQNWVFGDPTNPCKKHIQTPLFWRVRFLGKSHFGKYSHPMGKAWDERYIYLDLPSTNQVNVGKCWYVYHTGIFFGMAKYRNKGLNTSNTKR